MVAVVVPVYAFAAQCDMKTAPAKRWTKPAAQPSNVERYLNLTCIIADRKQDERIDSGRGDLAERGGSGSGQASNQTVAELFK